MHARSAVVSTMELRTADVSMGTGTLATFRTRPLIRFMDISALGVAAGGGRRALR